MALPTYTPKLTSTAPTAKAKEIATLTIMLLKPFTTRIDAIHRNGKIHIVYTADDYAAVDDKVEELMEHSLFSQRMYNTETEPEDARFLNHIASGLPVNLHAAI